MKCNKERKLFIAICSGTVIDVLLLPQYQLRCYVVLSIHFFIMYMEGNIKMDIQEVGEGCGYWMELAQDRDRWQAFVSTVMNPWVP